MGYRQNKPLTYEACESMYSRRLKANDYKRILIDCRLYKRDGYFEITHDMFVTWTRDPGSNRYEKITKEVPLATVDANNIVTMTYAEEVGMTACNRLTSLTGWLVGSNKSKYRNYEQPIRVYNTKGNWEKSVPYFAGMQWDCSQDYAKLLNEKPDVRVLVNPESTKAVRKEHDTLRKLARTMLRLGAYDDFAKTHMMNPWGIKLDCKSLAVINAADPVGDDVTAVLMHGAKDSRTPGMYYRTPQGQWVKRTADEVCRGWLEKAMDRGMKKLRDTFYETNDGYVKVSKQTA